MMKVVHLSTLLGRGLSSESGDRIGRLDDVIVRLRGDDYPLVTGLVARVGKLRVFLPVSRVGELAEGRVVLSSAKADLRPFDRREGEVLLKEDILGHRLIDVEDGRLLRAGDLEIEATDEGYELRAIDTRAPSPLLRRVSKSGSHRARDWKEFEPLVGHRPSAVVRAPFRRLRRLKPAQLADLLEEASREEGDEILEEVHSDPELEADVFEELDPDTANRLFGDKSDEEVAEVLAHMRADDAADAIADLPQERRQGVLEALPAATQTKVLSLLGFNPTTAGGLMGVEYVAVPGSTTAADALERVKAATASQNEALSTVYTVEDGDRLTGAVLVLELLRAHPERMVGELADAQTVCVAADTDLADVALLMADYNLVAIPVVDDEDRIIGLITVDDVLESTIPEDWRRREPRRHPEHPHQVQAEVGSAG